MAFQGQIGNPGYYSMHKKTVLLLVLVDVLVLLVVFFVSGFLNTRIDTEVYTSQIMRLEEGRFFEYSTDDVTLMQASKPLYAFLGSLIVPFFNPQVAILLINIFFLFGLTFVGYFFFLELGFDNKFAIAGSAWLTTGYPVLKYGLALGTDISGWFFALTVSLVVLVGVRKNNFWYFVLASLLGLLGFWGKETGVLGLVFGGCYILAHIEKWGFKKAGKFLLSLSMPFLFFGGGFVLFLHSIKFPTFINWYGMNFSTHAENSYELFYFLGTEISAFHVLLIFASVGMYYLVKYQDKLSGEWRLKFLSLFIASLPVLAWPMFISRVLYVQFLFFLPLAVYGVARFVASFSDRKLLGMKISTYLIFAPIATSVSLYLLAGNESLFSIVLSFL